MMVVKCGRVISLKQLLLLGGAKRVLGCSSKTSNEAIWGDMGLEFLQGRRDKCKLSWWYKVVSMPLSSYPKQLFQEEWNIKPRPGRQRKICKRVVDNIFESHELDKGEWVESISKGETSIKEFLALVDESINPLIPIVPKVDLPLRTDKCDFWNHFKTLIIWTLLLFCLFRLHKTVKRR